MYIHVKRVLRMSADTQIKVEEHYTVPNLAGIILETLRKVKNNPKNYTKEDFTTFDEFHLQGKKATLELAKKIPLCSGMRILDLGSGIGGPARTLASEFNCTVDGIELVREYYETAKILSELAHLDQITQFHHGSALEIPFTDQLFDTVWMQHMNMNIKEKEKLFSEANRVLKPGGILALYEICGGKEQNNEFIYPVPWASDSSINFLSKTNEFISIITNQGFQRLLIQDVTEQCVAWIRSNTQVFGSHKPNPLGLNLIAGSDFGLKTKNIVRNIQAGNLEIIQAIFEKPDRVISS